jgi:hypothetical protein
MHVISNFFMLRTNNGLERFNRELNDAFSVGHPSMVEFVSTIKNISMQKWTHHERISKRKEKAPVREPVVFPVLPEDFDAFVLLP